MSLWGRVIVPVVAVLSGAVAVSGAIVADSADSSTPISKGIDVLPVTGSMDSSAPALEEGMAPRELTPQELAAGGLDVVTVSDDIVYARWFQGGPRNRDNIKHGFQMFDVHDPSSPKLLWSWTGNKSPNTVFVEKSTAYIGWTIHEPNGMYGEFEILDVANPSAPKSLGTLSRRETVLEDMVVANGFAYVATWCGLEIIDVRDTSVPKLVGKYNTKDRTAGIALDGTVAYLVEYGLKAVDVSNPVSPRLLSSYDMWFYSSDVFVRDGIALLTYYYLRDTAGGLAVIDVSNPAELRVIDKQRFRKPAMKISAHDNIAYVFCSGPNDRLYDITNMRSPRLLQKICLGALEEWVGRVVLYKNLFFVSCQGGFRILDMSDPGSPRVLGTYVMKGE